MPECKHPREAELVDYYDQHLEYYSPVPEIMPALLNIFGINLQRVQNVLDVGCGDGRLSHWLAANNPRLVVDGIDYSQERLNKAAKVASDQGFSCRFLCRDLNMYVNESKSKYDLIVIFEVLEHLEDPAEVVRSCRKLLSDRGVMLGSVPLRMPYVTHLQVFGNPDDVQARLAPDRIYLVNKQLPHNHAFCEWKPRADQGT